MSKVLHPQEDSKPVDSLLIPKKEEEAPITVIREESKESEVVPPLKAEPSGGLQIPSKHPSFGVSKLTTSLRQLEKPPGNTFPKKSLQIDVPEE